MKVCDSDTHKQLGKNCWLCNGTGQTKTIQEVWREGVMRTATKKVSRCCLCKKDINIGDKYFDTHERQEVFKTLKVCMPCIEAEKTITLP